MKKPASEIRTLRRAAALLREEAACLKQSHTVYPHKDWDPAETAAKKNHHELTSVATQLTKLATGKPTR